MHSTVTVIILGLSVCAFARSQDKTRPPEPPSMTPYLPPSLSPVNPKPTVPEAITASSLSYTLGPGDQIALLVQDLTDEYTGKTFRVDISGDISLPLIGRFHVAGLTNEGVEQEVRNRLRKNKILRDPEVVVSIAEFASQPVSILGAVNAAGVKQIEGRKNLFEVISLAGGLRPDAGGTVNITRDIKWGQIPLPSAAIDHTGQFSTASVKVKSIMHASDPAQNITIMPGDTISVPAAARVYAVGSVNKQGGFLLGENETLSALQVVSLAEGLQKTAAGNKAKILRTMPGSASRAEIAVNIKQLMADKVPDIPLQPDDILFIPGSGAKIAGYRTLDSVVAISTGLIIYGRLP